MKIIKLDKKKNIIKLAIEDFNDIYFLSKFIKRRDYVEGFTKRTSLDRKEKIKVYLVVKVEKIEIKQDFLRVGGLIVNEVKGVEKGYHFFNFGYGDIITIRKEKLSKFDIELLENYQKISKKPKICLVFVDGLEGECFIYLYSDFSVISKEYFRFFVDKEKLEESIEKGIENLINYLNERYKDVKKLYVYRDMVTGDVLKKFNVNCVKTSTLTISSFLKESKMRLLKEVRALLEEEIFEKISELFYKDKIVYGLEDVKRAADYAALEEVYISLDLFLEKRDEIESLLEILRKTNTKYFFIMTDEGRRKMINWGKIVGVLRFKI